MRLGKIPQPETLKQQVGGRREGDRERGNIRSGDYIKQSRRMGRRGGSMEMRVVSGMGHYEAGGGYYPAPVAQGWIML